MSSTKERLSTYWKKFYAPVMASLAIASAVTIKNADSTSVQNAALGGLLIAVIGFLLETARFSQTANDKLVEIGATCPTREQIHNLDKTVDELTSYIRSKSITRDDVKELGRTLDELASSRFVKLWNISDGMTHLIEWLSKELKERSDDDTLEIDHLGLDMAVADQEVEKLIAKTRSAKRFSYRVLIMGPDSAAYGPNAPADVLDWARDSAKGRKWLEDLVESARTDRSRGHQVQLQYRVYQELPVFHGFAIRKPFVAYFLSYCRWQEGPATQKCRYDWGGKQYRICFGEPQEAQLRDLVNSFNAQFEHLWQTNQGTGGQLEEISPEKKADQQLVNPPTLR